MLGVSRTKPLRLPSGLLYIDAMDKMDDFFGEEEEVLAVNHFSTPRIASWGNLTLTEGMPHEESYFSEFFLTC